MPAWVALAWYMAKAMRIETIDALSMTQPSAADMWQQTGRTRTP